MNKELLNQEKIKEFHEQQKIYVNALVDVTVQVIGSIWPNSKNTKENNNKPIADLNLFLHHILKHSRTTHSTLQLAIFYLFRIRTEVQKKMKEDVYISCGRRMFLASLISAHKYLQDKTYKNSAWSKVSGLDVKEINHAEKVMLGLLDYRLYVKKDIFDQWIHMLQSHLNITPLVPLSIPSNSIPIKKSSIINLNQFQQEKSKLAQKSLPSPIEESIHGLKRKLNTNESYPSKKKLSY